jgi:hypothetical protein
MKPNTKKSFCKLLDVLLDGIVPIWMEAGEREDWEQVWAGLQQIELILRVKEKACGIE